MLRIGGSWQRYMGIHCTITETFLSLKLFENVKQNTNRIIRALQSDISGWLKRLIKITRSMLFCLRLPVK